VAIIGILAAIAIPNFMNYQCKAKQSEAKTLLGDLRKAQEAYYAENDEFATDLANAGFNPKGDTIYDITLDSSDDDNGTYSLKASATIRGESDTWTLDSDGNLENDDNACDS
ncbi:MAG: type IV pilin protein, partial [Desulfovibrionales bacterium]